MLLNINNVVNTALLLVIVKLVISNKEQVLISPEEVEDAKSKWLLKLRIFLVQKGWSVSNDEFGQWSKDGVLGSGTLTDEEAFWQETNK